jgi:hypothetical protein
MRITKVRMLLATVTALALMVGVGTAIAATTGSSDLKQEAARITARSDFDAAVAKSLGTTTAKLDAAITAAATARIDAALAAGEITSAEATTLKGAMADGMPAMRFATAAGVAKELGTTEAKVNAAYSDARKAQAKARVDQALAAGKITDTYATELKANIDAATFPGFGAGGMGHRGHGGPDGMGGPGGLGLGFGPPPGTDAGTGSSSTTATTTAIFA